MVMEQDRPFNAHADPIANALDITPNTAPLSLHSSEKASTHVPAKGTETTEKDIEYFEAECLTWEQIFGDPIFRVQSKYLLALDIEGIDFEALQDLLESSYIHKVDCISYEAVHMTSKESKSLLDRAYSLGLKRGGVGFDKNGFDRILLRERSFIEAILAKMSGLFASGHGWLLEIENHRILNLNR